MSASSILAAWVATHFTGLGARLMRNSVGMAWQGKVKKMLIGGRPAVQITEARRLPFGLLVPSSDPDKENGGSSDHIGWTPIIITPEHVGQTIAVFTAVEEKTLAYKTLTPDQRNFLDQVTAAGGLGYVARETADGPLLNRWPEPSPPRTQSKKKKT